MHVQLEGRKASDSLSEGCDVTSVVWWHLRLEAILLVSSLVIQKARSGSSLSILATGSPLSSFISSIAFLPLTG